MEYIINDIAKTTIEFSLFREAKTYVLDSPGYINGALSNSQVNKLSRQATISTGDLGYYVLEGARVHGLGLVSHQEAILYGKNIYVRSDMLKNPLLTKFNSGINIEEEQYVQKQDRKIIKVEGQSLLLSQKGIHIYGHWLLDLIPKLYLAKKNNLLNSKILLPKNTPNYAFEFLKKFQVSTEQVFLYDYKKEVLECEKLIIPTHCRTGLNGMNLDPIIGKCYLETFKPKKAGNKRIYLSRAKFPNPWRKMLNEVEIQQILSKAGFTTIFPEMLSLQQQINLIQDSEVIIGEFGSALHNSLFGNSELTVISLCGNHIQDLIQHRVCGLRNQRSNYIYGESLFKKDNRINADFFIESSIMHMALKKILQ